MMSWSCATSRARNTNEQLLSGSIRGTANGIRRGSAETFGREFGRQCGVIFVLGNISANEFSKLQKRSSVGTDLRFGLHGFVVRGLLFFFQTACGFGCIHIAGLTAVVERLENWRPNFYWSCTRCWDSRRFKAKLINIK
jgi:hypothetical protein